MKFHLNRFLRRVRIHGGEFDTSARAMYRDEVVYPLQADLRIVRRSTIERKQMSTKTTFKRIALVAVAALGFGVLSVVPSQAEVLSLSVSTPTAATTGATGARSDTTTASTFSVSALFDGIADTVTVSFVANGTIADPAGSVVAPRLAFLETTTASATQVDSSTVQSQLGSGAFVTAFSATESITAGGVYSISRAANGYAGAKFGLFLESGTSTNRLAGSYNYTIIVRSYSAGVLAPATTFYPAVITVPAAAVAAAKVPAAGNAKAFIQAGTTYPAGTVLADSATTGSMVADGTVIGMIKVSNFDTADAAASDTMTVSMTGPGILVVTSPATTGRSFVLPPATSAEIAVKADGASGEAKITITTAAGASFVKTVTFYDTKPSKAVATVAKAYIKAGTGSVAKVFSVVVTDTTGYAVTNAVVTAAPTDATTTVGGAATCGAYDTTDKVYYCAVKGLSTTKFGPVAYTIKATGVDTVATVVSTSATTTFADNVATKAVLAGPASGLPGAKVDYTLTLTEKNGYSVADQTYGVSSEAGVLFASVVATGWTTAPFATTDSFTTKSGVITSEGTLPLAGTATGTWTLVGDGLQTLAANAIDKTIGKTTLTVSTEVANPAADAATQAAEEAAAAAQDATDAALDATTAAEAAGALAQEAVDAVADLSAQVTTLIAALKDQITKLTNLVVKIQADLKKKK